MTQFSRIESVIEQHWFRCRIILHRSIFDISFSVFDHRKNLGNVFATYLEERRRSVLWLSSLLFIRFVRHQFMLWMKSMQLWILKMFRSWVVSSKNERKTSVETSNSVPSFEKSKFPFFLNLRLNSSSYHFEKICLLLLIIWLVFTKSIIVLKQRHFVPHYSRKSSKNVANNILRSLIRIELKRRKKLVDFFILFRSSQEPSNAKSQSESQDDHDVTMTEHGDDHEMHSLSFHQNQTIISESNY